MGYTMLKNRIAERNYPQNSLARASLTFIRENCEGLRFVDGKRRISIQISWITTAPVYMPIRSPATWKKISIDCVWKTQLIDF